MKQNIHRSYCLPVVVLNVGKRAVYGVKEGVVQVLL